MTEPGLLPYVGMIGQSSQVGEGVGGGGAAHESSDRFGWSVAPFHSGTHSHATVEFYSCYPLWRDEL